MGVNRAMKALVLFTCATAKVVQALQNSSNIYDANGSYIPITGAGGWEDALTKARLFVDNLTLTEKIYMVTGVQAWGDSPCVGAIAPLERLGFSGICLQDGPSAIRVADYISVYPAGLAAAASWDRDQIKKRGLLMAEEFKVKGAHVALGPTAGPLGRSPLDGRYWEGFGVDPYLSGEAISETIIGMQQAGVQACVKHYIGNEQETQRNPSTNSDGLTIEAVSSNIDDRTMHEVYSWPFAAAVRAGVASVMCSYNRVNETYSCQNPEILNKLLKEELGFQGYVVSDWGATHAGVAAIMAGLDMTMPGGVDTSDNHNTSFFGFNLTIAVNNGSLPIARLDDMILRTMTPYFQLDQDNFPSIDPSSADLFAYDPSLSAFEWNLTGAAHRDAREDHGSFIRELAASSTVLLKNINGALPLKNAPAVIGVYGNDAADEVDGLYRPVDNPTNDFGFKIGTFYSGGGSSDGRLTYLVPPLQAIKAWGETSGSLVQYILDNNAVQKSFGRTYPTPDVCFVFLKTYVGEGTDRTSFVSDWNGDAVVDMVTTECNNTIVVTHAGGVNTLKWADNPNVTAILAAHIPGQETGNSILDVITGKVNPSGRLTYTIAYNESDYNAPIVNFTGTTDPNAWQSDFTEGLNIDYRHFDSADIQPRYEFGFGLSYTTFNMSDLQAFKTLTQISPLPRRNMSGPTPGGNPSLYENIANVQTTITNTGSVSGATVPQLYLAFPQDSTPPGTPPHVLRGFDKITLHPGESQVVNFDLTRKDLSFWNTTAQDWQIPAGDFGIRCGFSSRDLPAETTLSFI